MALKISRISKLHDRTWLFRDLEFEAAKGTVSCIFTDNTEAARHLLELVAGRSTPNGGDVSLDGLRPDLLTAKEGNGVNILGVRIGRSANASIGSRIEATLENADAGTLFLLDEPFAGRTRSERENIAGAIMRASTEKGATVIFTSLDFKDALEFADNTFVLLNGNGEQFAPPQEIYERPASLAVARTVGRNNLLEARRLTSTKKDTPEFITIDGEHRLFAERTDKHSLGAINRNVTLAIRPEQISISFGASFPEDNLLKATVARVHPMGPTTRVTLDCSGLLLEALVLRLVGLNIGDECMVGLPPDRLQVLAA